MTDLTVLVSPTPLLPSTRGLFGRKTQFNRPIMVTLESEIGSTREGAADLKSSTESELGTGEFAEFRRSRRSRTPRNYDTSLLSPPVNTWKAPKQRHRPTRSQSAPPERRNQNEEAQASLEQGSQELPEDFAYRRPLRTTTSFTPGAIGTRGGELLRPPPPLLRPTTFWRKLPRSGVSGPSYSPSTHLVRRSTYIAAGLTFDAPVHDLSALCVESRPPSIMNWRTGIHAHYHRQNISPSPTPVPIPAPTPTNATSFTLLPLPSLTGVSGLQTTSSSFENSTSLSQTLADPSSLTQTSSTAVASAINELPTFKLVYLIPVIAVVGIILIIGTIWLVQGCVTRKAKTNDDDSEVLGGPRYEFINPGVPPSRNDDGLDLEKNFDDPHNFRSPYATPLSYELIGREEYNLSQPPYYANGGHAEAVVEPFRDGRLRSSQRARSTRSKDAMAMRSPPMSDTTSVAFLDMYESDEEKDDERRKREPWETLRHRSIKRGILENLQQEKGWMDSVRAVAGSTFVDQGGHKNPPPSSFASAGRELQDRLFAPKVQKRETEAWIDDGRQRRANPSLRSVVPQSRPTSRKTPSRTHTSSASDTVKRQREPPVDPYRGHAVGTPWTEETGFKIVQESPISSPLFQGKESQQQQYDNAIERGKAAIRDYFNYKLPPVGGSTVPIDHTIGTGPKDTRISMLPLSPPRIMSPPLENQLLFTPIPGPEAAGLPSSASPNTSNQALLIRATGRKGKRKASSSINIDKPLPYPQAAKEVVIAPLRPEKRLTKLVKARPATSGGKYQPVSRGSKGSQRGRGIDVEAGQASS